MYETTVYSGVNVSDYNVRSLRLTLHRDCLGAVTDVRSHDYLYAFCSILPCYVGLTGSFYYLVPIAFAR